MPWGGAAAPTDSGTGTAGRGRGPPAIPGIWIRDRERASDSEVTSHVFFHSYAELRKWVGKHHSISFITVVPYHHSVTQVQESIALYVISDATDATFFVAGGRLGAGV